MKLTRYILKLAPWIRHLEGKKEARKQAGERASKCKQEQVSEQASKQTRKSVRQPFYTWYTKVDIK